MNYEEFKELHKSDTVNFIFKSINNDIIQYVSEGCVYNFTSKINSLPCLKLNMSAFELWDISITQTVSFSFIKR